MQATKNQFEDIDRQSKQAALLSTVARRSGRVRQRLDYYMERVSLAKEGLEEPTTVTEALKNQQKVKWEEAMATELRSLQDNDVWELVEPPKDRKIVGSKWVFKVKTNEDGEMERYKARLVAQGYTQVKGADYDETFVLLFGWSHCECWLLWRYKEICNFIKWT